MMFLVFSFAYSQHQKQWKKFELTLLAKENAQSKGSYLDFLNEPSLSMGLYELKAGARDRQQPHPRDEVYYITEGVATLQVGDESIPVQPGSIVYVKTEVLHRFADIKKDLQILVIFSNTESSMGDPEWRAFNLGKLIQKQNDTNRSWIQFLDVASMRLGLLSKLKMPEEYQSGKQKADQIGIVVSGNGTAFTGNDSFELKPGFIFFLEGSAKLAIKNNRGNALKIINLFHKN